MKTQDVKYLVMKERTEAEVSVQRAEARARRWGRGAIDKLGSAVYWIQSSNNL